MFEEFDKLIEKFDEAAENSQSTLEIVKEVYNKGGVLEYNETYKSYIIGTESVEKILNALERNTPMKVKPGDSEAGFLSACGNCGRWTYEEDGQPNYCPRCGQKQDWREVDE